MTRDRNRIALAFSGGDAGVAALSALRHRGAEVVTLTLDVGQARELTAVRERALEAGAARAHVLDVREEFAARHVWPAVQGGLARTPLHVSALLLPLVAAKLVEIARIENAGAVAHEWGGKEAAHLERLVRREAGDLDVLAPVSAAGARVADGGTIWASAPVTGGAFHLTCEPAQAVGDPATIDIGFANGTPVCVNGVEMPIVELIESIETIAGAHGVGRLPLPNVAAGVIEAPAAVALEEAYRAVTALGARAVADATVRLRLAGGRCQVVSCTPSTAVAAGA
jgi:argininosuccinate synthase